MIYKYTMDVYPRTLYIAIDETNEAIMTFLNGNKGDEIPEMDEHSNACVIPVSDGEHGGVLIRFKNISTLTNPIIAHECFHSIMMFCNYLGITFNTSNDEHVAYMIEWAVSKVDEAIKSKEE